MKYIPLSDQGEGIYSLAPPMVGLERAHLLCVLRYRTAVRCVNGRVSVLGCLNCDWWDFL